MEKKNKKQEIKKIKYIRRIFRLTLLLFFSPLNQPFFFSMINFVETFSTTPISPRYIRTSKQSVRGKPVKLFTRIYNNPFRPLSSATPLGLHRYLRK
jgi:hypothetical protein